MPMVISYAPVGEKNIHREIKLLSKKIRKLEEILRKISERYFRPSDLCAKHGRLSPDMIVSRLRDCILKEIVVILFSKKEQNITQVTEELRKRRCFQKNSEGKAENIGEEECCCL